MASQTLPPVTSPPPEDLLAAVRAATNAAPPPGGRRRSSGFSLKEATSGERAIALLLGLYLGYAVVRLPEVFEQLAVPRGPMIMMLIFLAILGVATPADAWSRIWQQSRALRLVATLLGVALITIPVGIWPSGSVEFLYTRYLIAVVIFLACLVFLRDPRAFRSAVVVFVLSVTAVCANVLITYDRAAPVFNEDGDQIDPRIVAERPDLQRLVSVGKSLDPNDFGAILATALPLALWLSVGSFWRRLFWTGTAAVMVAAIVPTQSRGSMLGMLAAVTVVIGAGARGWRRALTFILVAGGVAAFVALATGIGAADRFSDFSTDDYNLGNDGRWYFWRQGFVWMLKRPWGYGLGNFPIYFGYHNGAERSAHSTWVQYGMELGVFALVTFVTLCVVIISGLRRLRTTAASLRGTHPEAERVELQSGHLLAMMAGLLVTGTFLSNAYYPLMYMGLGLCAATLLGSPFEVDPPHPPTPLAVEASRPAAESGRRRRRHLTGPAGSTAEPDPGHGQRPREDD